jgi:hypothetical protein
MMSAGSFIRLKAGRSRPESAKQAEIRLAIFLQILRIGRFKAGKSRSPKPAGAREGRQLRRFPPIMANLPKLLDLLSRSQF